MSGSMLYSKDLSSNMSGGVGVKAAGPESSTAFVWASSSTAKRLRGSLGGRRPSSSESESPEEEAEAGEVGLRGGGGLPRELLAPVRLSLCPLVSFSLRSWFFLSLLVFRLGFLPGLGRLLGFLPVKLLGVAPRPLGHWFVDPRCILRPPIACTASATSLRQRRLHSFRRLCRLLFRRRRTVRVLLLIRVRRPLRFRCTCTQTPFIRLRRRVCWRSRLSSLLLSLSSLAAGTRAIAANH